MPPHLRALFASAVLPPGTVTQVEELLPEGSGSLRRVSEPLSPFELTAGSWPVSFSQIAAHAPPQPGVYVLVAPALHQPGEAANDNQAMPGVYVGKSGNLRQRLRDHAGDPGRRGTLGFCFLSSPSGVLAGDHCCAVEALFQHLYEAHPGVVLEGRIEALPILTGRDRLVVSAAAAAMARQLRFSGLILPDLVRDLQPAAEPAVPSTLPTVHAELRFEPNSKTPFAGMLLLGAETTAGFLVRAGSEYRVDPCHDQPRSITSRREALVAGNYLEPIPGVSGKLRLSRDVLMTSANVASRVMTGYAVNNVAVHGSWQVRAGDLPEIR